MEITEKDIKIISKKFGISETKILNFLAEEEKKEKISQIKNSYLNKKGEKNKSAKEWLNLCLNYEDFEDYFFTVNEKFLDMNFFLKWLHATSSYKERRDIYNCIENKAIKKEFIKKWVDISDSLEDVREVMSYIKKSDDEYKLAVRKYLKYYT
ncbi:MAG TPA: hypothetical protein VJ926_00345 [Patescibacteria group bacterium]|nr:hypothetical protein [Patescibacteria group bacterium]